MKNEPWIDELKVRMEALIRRNIAERESKVYEILLAEPDRCPSEFSQLNQTYKQFVQIALEIRQRERPTYILGPNGLKKTDDGLSESDKKTLSECEKMIKEIVVKLTTARLTDCDHFDDMREKVGR